MDIILKMKALVMADILVFTYTFTHYSQELCLMLNTIIVVTETELVDGN